MVVVIFLLKVYVVAVFAVTLLIEYSKKKKK